MTTERRAPAPTASIPEPSAAVLVVVPPAPGSDGIGPETPVAGLPLLRRLVLAGARAGFVRILVHPALVRRADLLDGTTAAPLAADAIAGLDTAHRVVLLPLNVVPEPRWLRSLREVGLEPGRLHEGAGVRVVAGGGAGRLATLAGDPAALGAGLAGEPALLPAAEAGAFPLRCPGDVARAETWLLRSLIKDSEGFMSRHFERRLSLALTRRVARTRLTPNHMTIVSLIVGLAGAPFFLSASPALQLAGALLFLAHSILDGCDGELARLKFLESRWGAWLDYLGDNLVHVAVFACMAIGWSLARQTAWPLVAGAVAVIGTVVLAVHLAARTMMGSTGDTLADALAHRDFIYLIVALAAVGRAAWFLPLAAVGIPLFYLLVLWSDRAALSRARGEPRAAPARRRRGVVR